MKHSISRLSLLFFIPLLLPGCVPHKEDDQKQKEEAVEYITKDMQVKQKTTFTLQLPSNSTTGFSWKITSLDTHYLTVLDHTYEQDTTNKRMGAGGHEIWKLQAMKKGTTTIKLTYRQQWRTDKHGKHATITITIT